MDSDLTVAIGRLRESFAGYPVRPVLEGCPCCCPPERVAGFDLFDLSIRLGGTVGTEADLKSLLPLLLETLVATGELDEAIVLGRLAGSRSWPAAERDAVDGYLDAAWRAVLSTYPAQVGALHDAATFLCAVAEAGGDPGSFMRAWEGIHTPAADRHLADLVAHWVRGSGLTEAVVTWLRRAAVRERLYLAFSRDVDGVAADDYARAYDLLGDTGARS